MIAEITIENFRSFKEKHTLSLLATKDQELIEENTFPIGKKLRFLKSAVMYGANASGKSNFFKALEFFFRFAVLSGPRKQAGDSIGNDPFIFSKQTEGAPSSFEIIFYLSDKNKENVRYRYGFSVDNERIVYEYLFAVFNVREVNLFTREYQDIKYTSNFKEGARAKPAVRENCTLLSVSAQNNGKIATQIVKYFKDTVITSGLIDISELTMSQLDDKNKFKSIVNFLKFADINIYTLKSEKIPLNSAVEDQISFGHCVYDAHTPVGERFLPVEEESSGTQKLFSYSGPILEALEKGLPLFIDEFDVQLHPLMIESIVKLFNSPISNPHNAQLVISCHAVNILTNKIFRRDQIWFCEKDQLGATDLYSLVEYQRPVRKDASFSKDYLQGRYGASPYIDTIYLQTGIN
jgi:AAA15 family ATPase/GTPase